MGNHSSLVSFYLQPLQNVSVLLHVPRLRRCTKTSAFRGVCFQSRARNMFAFLSVTERLMVHHQKRCSIHLPVPESNSRANLGACTVRSSTVAPTMRNRAVSDEVLAYSICPRSVLFSFDHVRCTLLRVLPVAEYALSRVIMRAVSYEKL